MEHKKREESLLSPNKLAERKRNRAYRLSKHLQQIVPIESVVKIYLGRASCFSKISDYRRSIEDANSALSLDPACVQAYVRRGESLMQLQQFREASDTFREGLTVDPTHRVLKKRFADSLRGLRCSGINIFLHMDTVARQQKLLGILQMHRAVYIDCRKIS